GGKEVLTDSLRLVRLVFSDHALVEEVVENGADRINSDDFDVWILLFEVSTDPGDCAAGPHAHHEMRDPALGVFPDLRPRDSVMDLRVGRIRILVGMVG